MTIPTSGTFRIYDITLQAFRVVTLLTISVASKRRNNYQAHILPPNTLWASDTHSLSQKASGLLPLDGAELEDGDFG